MKKDNRPPNLEGRQSPRKQTNVSSEQITREHLRQEEQSLKGLKPESSKLKIALIAGAIVITILIVIVIFIVRWFLIPAPQTKEILEVGVIKLASF